ncbi:MAG TPA: flagellar type III secretion system pore protein FliP [Acetobacteraceae bacterium]|nr:flagellar type III secretion system pore protein FliP [Acetobacteraceae bacterium]
MDPSHLALMTTSPHGGGAVYSLDIQTLLIVTGLAFLPGLVLLMTGFTRIIVVLAILRQALGLTTTPPNVILIALAMVLTAFVMRPTLEAVNHDALQPYLAGTLSFQDAIDRGQQPFRAFMLSQVRKRELRLFINLSGRNTEPDIKSIPMLVLIPAFATSELQTAFEIGFLIYIPFALIDLAIASILMALGMIMVSPTLISLPFKLLLFVAIGGWGLLMGSVANSFIH